MATGSSAEAAGDTVCDICRGAGFVHPRLASGQTDYTRVVNCRCVRQKLEKERLFYLQRYSNLGALTRFTFDTLVPGGRGDQPAGQEVFRRASEAAKAFAAAPKGWLVLSGPPGSGKTHLAAAIANDRIARGKPALFMNTADLLDHLRATFASGSDVAYDQLFDQVRNAPLLVLDDFGVQSPTPWAQEKLDQLLNYRYAGELSTVIVLVKPLEELDERLRARLTDAGLCQAHTLDKAVASSLECQWAAGFELQKNMTFENFERRYVTPSEEQREKGYTREQIQQNLESAYRLALQFAQSPEGWLVFMGVTGCGKTHLAAAVANYRYKLGKPALFIVVPDFLDHLRSTFNPDSKVSYDELFESVRNTPLLIMDDFGVQSTTPWAREKLYQVVNYRYNARLATIVTTTLSLAEILEKIEPAISSRLVDSKMSTAFNIMAPDFRGDVTHEEKKVPYRRKNGGTVARPGHPQSKQH